MVKTLHECTHISNPKMPLIFDSHLHERLGVGRYPPPPDNAPGSISPLTPVITKFRSSPLHLKNVPLPPPNPQGDNNTLPTLVPSTHVAKDNTYILFMAKLHCLCLLGLCFYFFLLAISFVYTVIESLH